jgi:hypothetical protein
MTRVIIVSTVTSEHRADHYASHWYTGRLDGLSGEMAADCELAGHIFQHSPREFLTSPGVSKGQ